MKRMAQRKVDQLPAQPEKLTRLIKHFNTLKEGKFTGYIKVNFSQGNIGRVEQFEEILKKN